MLYIISPEGAPMVDTGGENFFSWFSRTQENAFLYAYSKKFVFCHTCFLFSRKVEGPWPIRPPSYMGPELLTVFLGKSS